MAKLRPADATLAAAVAVTINQLALDDVDRAAAGLARHYADAIDAGHCEVCDADRDLDELGHRLLAVLDALGATPAARAKLKGGAAASAGANRLSAIREARRPN